MLENLCCPLSSVNYNLSPFPMSPSNFSVRRNSAEYLLISADTLNKSQTICGALTKLRLFTSVPHQINLLRKILIARLSDDESRTEVRVLLTIRKLSDFVMIICRFSTDISRVSADVSADMATWEPLI